MKLTLVTEPTLWDGTLAAWPGASILQAYRWGEIKRQTGWRPYRLLLTAGDRPLAAAQLLVRRTPLGTVAYVPRGPLFGPDPRANAGLLRALHDLGREEGAVFLKIEPPTDDPALAAWLQAQGFRPGAPVQPQRTLIVDLRPAPDQLAARLHPKTRYNIGLARRRGVTVRLGSEHDLPVFYRWLQATSRRGRFPIHPAPYYESVWRTLHPAGQAALLMADYQDEPVAAALLLRFGPTAYYMYGASSDRHRSHKPNDLLQWEAMRWARQQGCLAYDLWGIPTVDPPPGATAGLGGVYHFKRGFGGTPVTFLGAFDYVYCRWRYALWTCLLRWRAAG